MTKLPPVWQGVTNLAVSLWPNQPWDDAVTTAMLAAAAESGMEITPELARRAMAARSARGGEGARFAPAPGEVLELAREIVIRERPALPAPEWPDPGPQLAETLTRWLEQASPERRESFERLREHLAAARSGAERHGLITRWFRDAGEEDVEPP